MHSYSTYRKQAQKQVPKYRRANYWNSVIYSTISELSKYPTELRNSIFKDLQLLWPLSEKINGVLLPPALGRRGKNLRVGRPEKPRPQVPRGSVSSLGFTSIGSEFTRARKKARPFHPLLNYDQSSWLAIGAVLGYVLCFKYICLNAGGTSQENERSGFHCRRQTKSSTTSLWLNLL